MKKGQSKSQAQEFEKLKGDLETQLRFERLLTRLSSRFVNLPVSEVDSEIDFWLKEISEFWGADRGGFYQYDPADKKVIMAHFYPLPEIDPWGHDLEMSEFSWFAEKMGKGEIIRLENIPQDLPDEADLERERFARQNTKSIIAVPFRVGGVILGSFAFSSHKKKKAWPEMQVQRLNLIGEIFANTLKRKQVEESMLETRERFQKAFENAAVGMVIFDPQGRYVEVNEFFCRMLGYEENEMTGRNINDFIYPDDREITLKRIEQALMGDIPYFWLEKRYLHKSGRPVWGYASSTLIRDRRGAPLYFISHIQDITESKKSGELLKEANTALKVLMDHRRQDEQKVTREIASTIDNLVFPYLQKLEATPLDNEQRAYIDIIQSNLSGLSKPLGQKFGSLERILTRTEMQVADLVRQAKTSQEIADLLRMSAPAVYFHRNNIRKKLGLRRTGTNLVSYLRSLDA